MGKKKTHSTTTIQAEGQGGAIVEHFTQDKVTQVLFSEIHSKQYTMAGGSTICNDKLFQHFGYTETMPALQAVQHTWCRKTPTLQLGIFLQKKRPFAALS
jgi:hypothetical protein